MASSCLRLLDVQVFLLLWNDMNECLDRFIDFAEWCFSLINQLNKIFPRNVVSLQISYNHNVSIRGTVTETYPLFSSVPPLIAGFESSLQPSQSPFRQLHSITVLSRLLSFACGPWAIWPVGQHHFSVREMNHERLANYWFWILTLETFCAILNLNEINLKVIESTAINNFFSEN